jgi:hypothetical protein
MVAPQQKGRILTVILFLLGLFQLLFTQFAQPGVDRRLLVKVTISRLLGKLQLLDSRYQLALQHVKLGLRPVLLQTLAECGVRFGL